MPVGVNVWPVETGVYTTAERPAVDPDTVLPTGASAPVDVVVVVPEPSTTYSVLVSRPVSMMVILPSRGVVVSMRLTISV